MKIENIVEIIYNCEGLSHLEVGTIGIITHSFGKYAWFIDIIDINTGKACYNDCVKEEQLRILDSMPSENKYYSEKEREEFKKIFQERERELRNFKEYDLFEVIRDRPEYAEEGFGVGDIGVVLFNYEHNGKIGVLINDYETAENIDTSVRREDIRLIEKRYSRRPKYTESEKEELIKLSDKLKEEYAKKDEERRKKFGY